MYMGPHIHVLADYGKGILDAVVGFNVSRVTYGKIYSVNEEGDVKIYLLGSYAT